MTARPGPRLPRALLLLLLLAAAACSSGPTGGPEDSRVPGPDAGQAADAAPAPGPDASAGGPDAGEPSPADAGADADAGLPAGPDASACVPDCTGRQCGSDGCTGACGACADGVCSADGRCTAEQAWAHPSQSRFFARPAIGPSGTVYTACRDHFVYAFTPAGTVKWKFDDGAELDEATIVVSSDERLFVTSYDGMLHCLSSAGQQLWSYDLITRNHGGALDANDTYWDFNRYKLFRFASDGTVASTTDVPEGIQDSPVLDSAGTVFLPVSTGVRALGGGKSWQWAIPATLPANTRAHQLSLAPGKVLVTVGESGGWTGAVYALDASTGQALWSWTAPYYTSGSVTVDSDGTVYVMVRNKGIYALDANGQEKWHHTHYIGDEPVLIASNAILYHADQRATALTTGGSLLWTWPEPNRNATANYLALGNGRLYLPGVTQDFFSLVVSSTGLKSAPWPKARHDARNTGCLANQ